MSDSKQLLQAITLAVQAHGDQLDKAGLPYILHPLHVMDSVDGIDAKIVAVLHDVVEDTDWKIVRLFDDLNGDDKGQRYLANETDGYQEFPDHIIEALDAISKRKSEKLEAYWTRVKNNPLALEVKLADITHNTSEKRLSALSEDERSYLRGKYEAALEFLTGDPNGS